MATSLSDLVTGKRRADPMVGLARAALGQGLGMGWGDEAEAWLRSKLGSEDYATNVKRIRDEYAQYSKESPFISGAAEFAGGVAPGVALMLVPGGQGVGATQIARSTGATMARMGGLGALSGAISGAGNATEGDRLGGAAAGAALGGTFGAAVPLATKGGGAAVQWLRERIAPSDAFITQRAAGKLNTALQRSEPPLKPIDIQRQLISDQRLGVPSVLANTSKPVASLTEVVAQRSGKGANKIEDTLEAQMLGARERITQQTQKQLNPGNYYDDLAELEKQMKDRAGPAYAKAYEHGEVKSPEVKKFLELPQFKKATEEVQDLLALEGKTADFSKPTVENLDYIKRGLDSLIEKETDSVTGKLTARGRVLADQKNKFLEKLDEAVPDYELARGVWGGGAQLRDAMDKGLKEFNSSNHEQVAKLMAKMAPEEREAYTTGVVRHLYGVINNSAQGGNKAKAIIGSPEMQQKLQPLFDSPSKYKLFEAALQRESQLYQQAGKILSGSPTARRTQMAAEFDGNSEAGQAIGQALTGGVKGSLIGMAMRAINGNAQMSEKTADKLADMLMSKNPNEVAAVVQLLEQQAKGAIPKAVRAGATEAGLTTGTVSAGWPAPIESDQE